MHLLSEGYTPNHRVDSFVVIVFGQLRSIEMQLQNSTVHFQHAFEGSSEDIAFLDIEGLCASHKFHMKDEVDPFSKGNSLNCAYLFESVSEQPEMNLVHLSLNHVIMGDVEVGCKFSRSDMIHDPNKQLVEHPIEVFTAGRVVVFAGDPFKLEVIEKSPVFYEFFALQVVVLASRVL